MLELPFHRLTRNKACFAKRVFPETRRVARVRVHPNGNYRHFTSDAAEPKRFEQKSVFSTFRLNFRELVRAVLSVDFWQTPGNRREGNTKGRTLPGHSYF